MKLLTLLVLLLAWPTSSQAGLSYGDGDGYYEICKNPSSEQDLACLMYLRGLSEATMADSKNICLPDNVTPKQIKDYFMQFLKDNPKDRNHPTLLLLQAILIQIFPCK